MAAINRPQEQFEEKSLWAALKQQGKKAADVAKNFGGRLHQVLQTPVQKVGREALKNSSDMLSKVEYAFWNKINDLTKPQARVQETAKHDAEYLGSEFVVETPMREVPFSKATKATVIDFNEAAEAIQQKKISATAKVAEGLKQVTPDAKIHNWSAPRMDSIKAHLAHLPEFLQSVENALAFIESSTVSVQDIVSAMELHYRRMIKEGKIAPFSDTTEKKIHKIKETLKRDKARASSRDPERKWTDLLEICAQFDVNLGSESEITRFADQRPEELYEMSQKAAY